MTEEMEKVSWKQILFRLRWAILIFVSVSIGGIIAVFTVDRIASKKEQQSYLVRPWKVRSCPFPFSLRVVSESYKPGTAWRMAKEINRELAMVLGGRDVYVESSRRPTGHVEISLRDSSELERISGAKCFIPALNPAAPVDNDAMVMGFFHYRVFEVGDRLLNSVIIMCSTKFKTMVAMPKKPSWLRLYPDYWDRYVKHELMHPIMGAGHPNWHADVTHANAPHQEISGGTRKILRRIYGAMCEKKRK